jgi:hypothetical protein
MNQTEKLSTTSSYAGADAEENTELQPVALDG